LNRTQWKRSAHGPFLHWEDIKRHSAEYLVAVVSCFAEQACLATRERAVPAAQLDTLVDGFFGRAAHQLLYGLHEEKIRKTWSVDGIQGVERDLRPRVLSAPWHVRYLEELPRVYAAAMPSGDPSSDSPEEKGRRRTTVVVPRLNDKGWGIPQWAQAAGVSQVIVYDYVNGKSDPRASNRKALAQAIGMETDDLPL